ncbi:coiled-coil domain-containing protein 33-like isoform X2 [Polyodon spathula]|uniref:coiled-coil domain-containing protein 33-like isoform X2 n=1 Tax=Polyodon spathula TaxID=7913 RepID=UPI001B7E5AD1|nr:coiled-coil domain-containing protein 33-like isoform X2 [Polyodon spathula]
MQRTRLKIEARELDFEFEVLNVQFNELGKYVLRLTVENPLLEDSGTGVQLRVNDGEVLYTSTGTTDVIQQSSLDEVYTCLRYKFVFTLPQGFCKNDKNHDVRLKIEALRVPDSQVKNGTKVGEAFFAIYPRTNAPRINLYARKDEELYHYSNIMALLRVQNDYLAMHCGRLAYTVSFHEARPPPDDPNATSRMPSIQEEGKGGGQTPRASSPAPSTLSVPPLIPEPTQQQDPEPSPSEPTAQVLQLQPESERRSSPESMLESPSESLPPTPDGGLSSSRPHRRPSEASLHFPSPQDTPGQSPEPLPATHVMEAPPGKNEVARSPLTNNWHVSRPRMEAITVILHGATNLPPLSDGAVPQPFATVKSGTDEKQKLSAQGVTHATVQPTHSPSWEEKVTVEVAQEDVKDEVVILNVADSRTKELLASYRLPIHYLQPFHHYHMELVQAHKRVPAGVRLYATVVRKGSAIPRQPGFSFTGFEVLLQALEKPLLEPVGPLLSVARIVPDYESYKSSMLVRTPRAAGIAVTTITLPSLHLSSFEVLQVSSQGYPQVSQAGFPQEQPVWNHSFLFHGRDGATAFTGGAALVLEYYPVTTVMNTVCWHIRSPLGFSALSLDEDVYRKLMAESGQRGIRVEKLPVQGTTLRTTSNTIPSVGIILRLIGSERPDSLLASANPSLLPTLGSKPLSENGGSPPPVPPLSMPSKSNEAEEGSPASPPTDWSTQPQHQHQHQHQPQHPLQLELQRDGINLPSYDALTEILPEYEHLFRAPISTKGGQDQKGGHIPHRQDSRLRQDYPGEQDHTNRQAPHGEHKAQDPDQDPLSPFHTLSSPLKNRDPIRDPVYDGQATEVIEHESRELENYRTAMRKMAEDIIALRRHVGNLESDNSKLRSELTLHQDLGKTLLDDTDIDVMTKAEITDRIASLKFKLASGTAEVKTHKDKIQQLQNELIRKNDCEKELLHLQRAHQQQQAVLQRYQDRAGKVKSLEGTIRQQEKVIEKMEKVLDTKLKEKNRDQPAALKKQTGGSSDNLWKEIESALASENSRLRAELEKLRYQSAASPFQQPFQKQDSFSDTEKMSLMAKLEKAQGRIQMLETQLEENARRWGREKQDMLTRLNEQEHGFARSSTMILHDFPQYSTVTDEMRHSILNNFLGRI